MQYQLKPCVQGTDNRLGKLGQERGGMIQKQLCGRGELAGRKHLIERDITSKDLKAASQCSWVESSSWLTLAKGNRRKVRGTCWGSSWRGFVLF